MERWERQDDPEDTVKGWLTARNVFSRIKNDYERRK